MGLSRSFPFCLDVEDIRRHSSRFRRAIGCRPHRAPRTTLLIQQLHPLSSLVEGVVQQVQVELDDAKDVVAPTTVGGVARRPHPDLLGIIVQDPVLLSGNFSYNQSVYLKFEVVCFWPC